MNGKVTDIPPDKPIGGGKRKILPTPRIAFNKQLDILRAYSAASGEGTTGVSNEAVAGIVGLSASTVSLANPFLADIGLIEKREGGYAPVEEVVSFARTFQWDEDFAGHELGGRLRGTWFGQALLPRLNFGAVDESTALRELGKAANAEPSYRSQLKTLLDYLEAGHLIVRNGGQVEANQDAPAEVKASVSEPPASPKKTEERDLPQPQVGGGLPLLIQGLLQQLPPAGASWSRAKADGWLDLAKLTLEMVYDLEKSPDSDGSRAEANTP